MAQDFRRKAQEYFDLARAISLETERAILIDTTCSSRKRTRELSRLL